MELLEHDMNKPRTYSSSEITDLTLELLKILNEIHNENIIHQDLKPHNIMRSKENKLYIIDFGLAKHLSEDKNHYSIKGFIGTPRYASVRAHNMFEQSKKDDLESLFYNIAYLYYQKLPWSKLHVANEVKLEKIKTLKVRNRETLFDEMPLPFQKAFEYITGMRPFSEPDYSFLKGLFKRNKTVLVPNHREALEERSKMKRVSLNLSNFLQVPDVINEPRGKNLEDRDGNSSNGSRTKSINSFGVASDVILSQFL
jgi:serine/threonine protein kinase